MQLQNSFNHLQLWIFFTEANCGRLAEKLLKKLFFQLTISPQKECMDSTLKSLILWSR